MLLAMMHLAQKHTLDEVNKGNKGNPFGGSHRANTWSFRSRLLLPLPRSRRALPPGLYRHTFTNFTDTKCRSTALTQAPSPSTNLTRVILGVMPSPALTTAT